MHLSLSLASAQGLWILTDPTGQRLLAERRWDGGESSGLQSGLEPELRNLFQMAGLGLDAVHSLSVVTGPGAFTGLRIAASFQQGMARARKLPLYALPTFALFDRRSYLPLQHQKLRRMSLEESLAAGLEWLEVTGPREFNVREATWLRAELEAGHLRTSDFRGHRELEFWPSPEELRVAVQRRLADPTPPSPIEILYGLEPKISGQRQG